MKRKTVKIIGVSLAVFGFVLFFGSIGYAVVADIMRAYVPMTLFASGIGGLVTAAVGGALLSEMEADKF